jgi:hypothetical protein
MHIEKPDIPIVPNIGTDRIFPKSPLVQNSLLILFHDAQLPYNHVLMDKYSQRSPPNTGLEGQNKKHRLLTAVFSDDSLDANRRVAEFQPHMPATNLLQNRGSPYKPANKSSVFSASYKTARSAKDSAAKYLDLFKLPDSSWKIGRWPF